MIRTCAIAALATSAFALGQPAFGQCPSSETSRPVALGAMADHHNKGKMDIVDTAVEAGSFNTLAAALKAAGLIDALKGKGPFTVFAPTDDAFAALPEGTVETLLKPENKAMLTAILTYHVVPGRVPAAKVVKMDGTGTLNGQRANITVDGSTVKVDNATVVKTDIKCTNGIIHVIDRVILPSDKDLIDTAVDAGSFSTLAAALKAAGLIETLKGEGPFTVFAPTDAAFAKLPAGTVEDLLKPENKDQLIAILTYHVVPGRLYASDVVKQKKLTTVQGQRAGISMKNGNAMIDAATILDVDIDTTNGVIHVIDSVILPKSH